MDVQIGKVTAYFAATRAAVVEVLGQPLRVGDRVAVSGMKRTVEHVIEELTVGYRHVPEVAPGETCVVAIGEPVEPGDMVFLVQG